MTTRSSIASARSDTRKVRLSCDHSAMFLPKLAMCVLTHYRK